MISIVISTYNDLIINKCLAALENQTNRNFEICLVNDGGERTKFESHLRLKSLYLEPKSTQFRLSQARNLGIKHATGRRIILLDQDCIPEQDFVKKHAQYNQELVAGYRTRINGTSMNLDPRTGKTFANQLEIAKHCYGCNMSFPKNLCNKIGGFREDFKGWGYEDVEFALRMLENGCEMLIDEDILVFHVEHPAKTPSSKNQELYLETVNRVTAIWKHRTSHSQ